MVQAKGWETSNKKTPKTKQNKTAFVLIINVHGNRIAEVAYSTACISQGPSNS